ncbi:MAG: hypothetical protein ABIN18_27370 [Pseudomonadota bacterium]
MSPPKIVGELGPGDSIVIGLAALLSGTEMYYGMDVVEHASLQQHIKMLDELVNLEEERTFRTNRNSSTLGRISTHINFRLNY